MHMDAETAAHSAVPERGPMLLYSAGLPRWLEGAGCSLALTTYQAGRPDPDRAEARRRDTRA
jgi:hypothetical protein